MRQKVVAEHPTNGAKVGLRSGKKVESDPGRHEVLNLRGRLYDQGPVCQADPTRNPLTNPGAAN